MLDFNQLLKNLEVLVVNILLTLRRVVLMPLPVYSIGEPLLPLGRLSVLEAVRALRLSDDREVFLMRFPDELHLLLQTVRA